MKRLRRQPAYLFPILAALSAAAVFVCLFLYQNDNKYTAPGPQGERGVLTLDEEDARRYPVVFLVEGWAYYGGRLLSPDDFRAEAPSPDAYIFIGQYGGFDAGDLSASPHGSASYRLTIRLPEEKHTYLLELPEIFSAYRCYVNGELAQTMGEPDPAAYRPETGNRTVRIEAAGEIDLLLAVSDFTHFYSGVVYPPAFGEPDAVATLLNMRLVFRSLVLSFALAIGALALLVGFISGKSRASALYGLLCLCFIGYTSYPLLRSFVSGLRTLYVIENISFCAMLTCVMLLQRSLFGRWNKRSLVLVGFGVLMCAASALLPFSLTRGGLLVMGAYSYLIMALEWLTAGYLTLSAIHAVLSGQVHSVTMLGALLVLDISLMMDRLLPLHEPILTGWFPELASFALLLAIGTVVIREVAGKYRDNAVLEERADSMERLSELHRENYALMTERMEETRTLRHDLRHHFVMLEGFLQDGAYDQLAQYIREFEHKAADLQTVVYSRNPVVNVLLRHYAGLAERENVELTAQIDVAPDIPVSEAELAAVLSNLIENGLEACRRQESGPRFLSLAIGQKPSMLSIHMKNSTDGKVVQQGDSFPSSKARGRKGYGLDSIRAVAKRYQGDAQFEYDEGENVFTSTVFLTF